VDLSVLFSWKVDKRVLMEAQRDLTLIFNSGADVRHQFIHIIATVFGAACANSPGILLMLSPFVVFSVTALWFNKVKCWFINLMTRAIGNLYFRPA
jgi:hypothetical protein